MSRTRAPAAAIAAAGAVLALAAAATAAAAPAAVCGDAPGGGLTLANVASDGARLVAVGSDGLVATSANGGRWTVRPTPVQHALRGAVWTGRRWVVVGDAGTILTSADGGRWSAATGIPSAGLRAVAARPGLVAVGGSSGALVTSSDGLAWTPRAAGTAGNLWGGTAIGPTVVLSGKAATVIASDDSATWRPVPIRPRPTDDQASPRPFLWQMAANGSRLVAVGDFGSVLEGSLTGLRAVPSPTDEILRGVAFRADVGVAVGSGGVILRSAARGRWVRVPSPTTVDLRGVAVTSRGFVAVGDEGTVVTSSEGRSWRLRVSAMPCTLLSVAHGPSGFVAVGGSGRVLMSTDGTAWRAVPRPTPEDLYGVAHGPGGYVAVGAAGVVLRSPDGVAWTRAGLPSRLNLHAVAWDGHGYLAGGDRGRLFASVNGRRWRRVPFTAFHSIRDFATEGDVTVVAGAGTIGRHRAGGPWTLEPVGFGKFQTSVTAGGDRFVIVGHNGTASVSTDSGRTWTAGRTGVEVNLDRVVFAGGWFVATGEGRALRSRDGLAWRPLALPAARSIRSIAVDGPLLVAVGDGGVVLRSDDGGRRWRVVAPSQRSGNAPD